MLLKIQFCGAARTVTGSCFRIETAKTRFLVDCGMFQGGKALKEYNYGDFAFDPKGLDFVLLTHAHVDHCGLLPKLYKNGFDKAVHMTLPTLQLCGVVLPDSGHIQEIEVQRKNRKLARTGAELISPIYTAQDAYRCLSFFEGHGYQEIIRLAEDVKIRFQDAGHILGSAMIEVWIGEDGRETKLVFSGDIGNVDQAIVRDPTYLREADFVVMESTYGDRYHIHGEDKVDALAGIVDRTVAKGGNLIVPSFAVERTQALVYTLKRLKEEGRIPRVEIYIDSPMAVEATKIFARNPDYYDDEAARMFHAEGNRDIFADPDIHYVVTAEESMALNAIRSGAVILSASGMADAGRIKHHLKHHLWRPESTVLFVGYQAEGTLGRRILDGEKQVRIHGENVAVKAEVALIDDFSSHADQKGLMEWARRLDVKKPRRVFLVHGEQEAAEALSRLIREELGLAVEIPDQGTVYDLSGFEPVLAGAQSGAPERRLLAAELGEAFDQIKGRITDISRDPRHDKKVLQRLLARVYELEAELRKY
jgi:metallo-beta-lactamase family protein